MRHTLCFTKEARERRDEYRALAAQRFAIVDWLIPYGYPCKHGLVIRISTEVQLATLQVLPSCRSFLVVTGHVGSGIVTIEMKAIGFA